jgi:hypothetical protein
MARIARTGEFTPPAGAAARGVELGRAAVGQGDGHGSAGSGPGVLRSQAAEVVREVEERIFLNSVDEYSVGALGDAELLAIASRIASHSSLTGRGPW